MPYVVFGAGAVGGVVGAFLVRAGHRVTLVARGEHLRALQTSGLTLETPEGSGTVTVDAVGRARDVDWTERPTVLLAVKSQQTPSALADLAEVAPPDTAVVCLQNGIANEPAALRVFARVYGVCVACPAGHLAAGVVQAWSAPCPGLLDLGRFPAGTDEECERVSADLGSATFSSHPVPDIRRWKLRKLLVNLGNAVEATCGPDGRRSALGALVTAEGEAVLAAAGLEVASAEEDRTRRGQLLHLGSIEGRTRPGGSTWQSLRRGTGEVETDYLNGEIVLLGRLHGVSTPANELLQLLTRELAARRIGPGTVAVQSVLDAVAGGPVPRTWWSGGAPTGHSGRRAD